MKTSNSRARLGMRSIAIAAAALLAVGISACADTGSDAGGETSGPDSSAMAKAQEAVEAAKQPITAKGDIEPVDTSGLAGKTVYVLQADAGNSFVTTISDALEEANDKVGVKTVTLDGQQNAANYNSLINQAISQKADLLVLINVGLEVPNAIKAAKDAGIPLIVSGVSSASDWQISNATAEVGVDTEAIGKLQSDLAYTISEGDVHAIGYGAQEFPQDVAQLKGQGEELQALCPDTCTHQVKHVQLTSYQGDTPKNVRADLLANPDVNWLMPAWDFLATYIKSGLALSDRTDVHMSSWNGIPAALDMVSKGELDGTFGVPLRQWGWQLADTGYRLMAEMPAENVAIPTRLITKDVLEQAGGDLSDSSLYGNDDVFAGFLAAWGVK